MRNISTQLGTCNRHPNGKWDVSFESFVGEPGKEQLMSVCRSAPVWDTEDEAWKAGPRALTFLEDKGMFPNMCERW